MELRGEVVYLYAFDVGHEILVAQVESQPARRLEPLESRRPQLAPQDVTFYQPLTTRLPPPAGTLDGQVPRINTRIFGVGSIAIAVHIPMAAASLSELRRHHDPHWSDGRPLSVVAREICDRMRSELGEAIRGPVPTSEPEAYIAFCVTDLGGETNANLWLERNRRDVAGLLTNLDADRLSDNQVSDTLRYSRSLENADLAVIDWDDALLIDLAAFPTEVLYVLELANLQLQEFRAIDAILDQHLNRVYDHLGRPPGLWHGGSATLRDLRQLRVDVARLADEVTNITKFVGDWFLARVYLSARERFHLDEWRASLEQRLGQLDRLYGVVHSEVNERRMLGLELAIVILILIELLASIFVRR